MKKRYFKLMATEDFENGSDTFVGLIVGKGETVEKAIQDAERQCDEWFENQDFYLFARIEEFETFTKEIVENIIEKHNKKINDFINDEIPKRLNLGNRLPTMDEWFKAQEIIHEQRFYARAELILKMFRSRGFNVKIDLQTKELALY